MQQSIAVSDCTCTVIRGVARHITRIYDEHLGSSGLKLTQYAVLSRLNRLGASSLVSLAREGDLDVTSMSRAMRPLIAAGLVEAGNGPDGRTNAYALTESGKQTYEQAHTQWLRAQEEVNAMIPADLQRELGALSRKLRSKGATR